MKTRNISRENNSNKIFIPGVSDVIENIEDPTIPQQPIEQDSLPMLERHDNYERLNKLFEDQNEQEKRVTEAREILGDPAKDLTDDQLFELVNNMQFLVDIWEEEFEKEIFNGKTLNELLGINKL